MYIFFYKKPHIKCVFDLLPRIFPFVVAPTVKALPLLLQTTPDKKTRKIIRINIPHLHTLLGLRFRGAGHPPHPQYIRISDGRSRFKTKLKCKYFPSKNRQLHIYYVRLMSQTTATVQTMRQWHANNPYLTKRRKRRPLALHCSRFCSVTVTPG